MNLRIRHILIVMFTAALVSVFVTHSAREALGAETAVPLRVDEFVSLVKRNNRTLLAQQKSVEAAYYSVLSSVSYQRPSLSAAAGFSYLSGQEQIGVPMSDITAAQAGLSLSAIIDLSGKYGLDEQQQILYYESTRASFESSVNSLTAAAEEAYYSAVFARENISLQEDIRLQRVENLRVTDEKYNQGLVPKLDVIRAEGQVIETESTLAAATADYKNIISSMSEMAGGFRVAIADARLSPPPSQYEYDIEKALLQRPDIRAYNLALERAKIVKKLRAKGMSPTLSAGLNWMPFADPWNSSAPQKREVSFGLNLSIPIYDGRSIEYQILNADSLMRSAEASLAAAVGSTETQIEVAVNNIEKAIAVEFDKNRQIATSEEELRITRARYLDGIGSQIDLINAFTENQQVRTAHLGAIKDIYIALVQLHRALGDYSAVDGAGTWEIAVREHNKR